MLMLNKTHAAVTNSIIALLPHGANRALVCFRMTSSNQENGFVGQAVVADPARNSFTGLRVPPRVFLSARPVAAGSNSGLTSAPRLPRVVQTKPGSISESLTWSALQVVAASVIAAIDQDIADADAHFAEGDFRRVGRHRTPALKSGHCISGQLSVASLLSLDGRTE